MNVDHTDQSPLETGLSVESSVPKADGIDVDIGDLSPLAADRAADGTRSKLTAAPPPIPARGRRNNTLPPPIPRAARGSSTPKLVEPKATPEMMASWQINPEGPLRPSAPPPIPVTAKPVTLPPPIPAAAKSATFAAVEPPAEAAPPAALPTTIELVRAIEIAKPEPAPIAPLVTGNAPSVMESTTSSAALPVVQQEIIPSPRESRVAPLPTSQPGADVADLPMWPATMGAVLATRAAPRDSAKLPAPRGRNTLPPPIPSTPMPAAPPVLVAPPSTEVVANQVSALDGSDGWVFDDAYEESQVDGEVVPTTYFARSAVAARKRPTYLIAAGGAAAVIAVIAIAMHGSPTPTKPVAAEPAPAAATAPAPTPAPAPAAAIAPAPVTHVPAPSLTTLPITSWPNGATVTLVDNGNATVLGRTPVSAALDPSHSYDVVLAVVGRPTVVQHIDFATMHEVAVDLDPDPAAKPAAKQPAIVKQAIVKQAAPVEQEAAAPTPVPPAHHHHHDHAVVAAMPAPAPAREPAKPKQVAIAAPVAPAGTGTLMVSAKPPCEILVDGKSTHLMTPQHAIALSPGTHAITLVNAAIGVKKTIAVKVEAKQPTKLIQDFTKS